MTVAVFSILFTSSVFSKTIIVNVDGVEKQIFVFGKTVADVLTTVSFDENDTVSVPTYEKAYNGQVLYVNKAFPIMFRVNSNEKQFYTTTKTVCEFLADNKIELSSYDVVEPSLDTVLDSSSAVNLTKADVEFVTETAEIPFKTVAVPNNRENVGSKTVKNEGEKGLKEISYMVVTRNGTLVSKEITDTKILKKPVDKVTEYGTVAVVLSSRGDALRYKEVIKMSASAYDLSYQSTGKRVGDRGYGVTASGMRVKRGVVAVDTRVIPLGTRLYIESSDGKYIYGNAVAADTGGAIKGNKIDLFMETNSECRAFGRRSVNVYILE
jgi:uncharacterized protein YabE (DUF348 family)